MARMVITVKPWAGEYELDEDLPFNAREWEWIKKGSGYMPVTLPDGFRNRDPSLFVVLAVVAMCRSGRVDREDGYRTIEELKETPFDFQSITMVGDAEDDADPPALTGEPDASSPTSSPESSNDSGEGSKSGSAPSDGTRPVTTLLRSGTS